MKKTLSYIVISIILESLLGCTLLADERKQSANMPVTFDLLIRVEFSLNYPAEVIWPHIIDTQAWLKTFPIETVAGKRGEEGEVIRISVNSGNGAVDSYYSKTVKIVPKKLLIVKYLPWRNQIASTDNLRGYDVYELREINGKTRVIFQTFQEYSSGKRSEEEFQSLMKSAGHLAEKRWYEIYIPALKNVLNRDIP